MQRQQAKTLENFGYQFSEEGRLRSIEDQSKYFHVDYEKFRMQNPKSYEEIGKLVDEYVYSELERGCCLHRLPVPKEGSPDWSDSTFIFASKDFKVKDKLMVLIQGSGVVKAGQWSRELIFNEGLKSGSQIPYIKRALEAGYGVLVLNTNDNSRNGRPIKKSEDAVSHAKYVWQNYIRAAKADYIAIVAHSYGGHVTKILLESLDTDDKKKVFAVAFTNASVEDYPSKMNRRFNKIARNWITSDEPLGTFLSVSGFPCVSAGTGLHKETSHKAINEVFMFIKMRIHEEMRENAASKPANIVRQKTSDEYPEVDSLKEVARNGLSASVSDYSVNNVRSFSSGVGSLIDIAVNGLPFNSDSINSERGLSSSITSKPISTESGDTFGSYGCHYPPVDLFSSQGGNKTLKQETSASQGAYGTPNQTEEISITSKPISTESGDTFGSYNCHYQPVDLFSSQGGNKTFKQETSASQGAYGTPNQTEEIRNPGMFLPLVALNKKDQEFREICTVFLRGCGVYRDKIEVLEILRNDDKASFESFTKVKEQVKRELDTLNDDIVMKNLWYGSIETNACSVVSNGFDRGLAGNLLSRFGKDIYFAVDPSYCIKHGFARMKTGVGQIILAKVVTGRPCLGKAEYNVLPAGYHSGVDDVDSPNIYMAYGEVAAFPHYLIYFLMK